MKTARLRTSLLAVAVCAAGFSPAFAQDLTGSPFQLPEALFQPESCSAPLCAQVNAEPTPKPTPEQSIPSIADIFKASVNDFRALPTRSNLMILGAGLAVSGGLSRADQQSSIGLSGSSWAEGPFGPTGTTGQFPLHVAAGFAAYGLGRAAGSSSTAVFGADLVRAQLLAQVTTQAIKFGVGRVRPDGTSHSFPSGHTSTMFATATVIQQHFGWKAGIPAYAAATWVAAGRIQGRRHYLSDVAFGAALGIVAGRTVTVGSGRAQFEVAPLATPGGMGIGFTHVQKCRMQNAEC